MKDELSGSRIEVCLENKNDSKAEGKKAVHVSSS